MPRPAQVITSLPDLHMVEAIVLLDVDVDGKMGIDVSHLVFVSLGDAGDQVLDDRLDGSESCDVLP